MTDDEQKIFNQIKKDQYWNSEGKLSDDELLKKARGIIEDSKLLVTIIDNTGEGKDIQVRFEAGLLFIMLIIVIMLALLYVLISGSQYIYVMGGI